MSGSSRGARHRARELTVQALYQHQLAGHSAPELTEQFTQAPGFEGADADYFKLLVPGILADTAALDGVIASHAERDVGQLDPVGRAILWLAIYELRDCRDVPTGVVIDEAVELAKSYGATDSHRFVNAVLDRARQTMTHRRNGRRVPSGR